MTAPTSLAETLAEVVCFKLIGKSDQQEVCEGCADDGERLAEAARAWLVARLNEHGPEVIDSHQFRMLRHGWGCSCGGDYLAAHAAHVVAALTEVLTDD